jgi:hypothetical protein
MQGWTNNQQQPRQNQQNQGFLDFNKISELPSKYPRADLP